MTSETILEKVKSYIDGSLASIEDELDECSIEDKERRLILMADRDAFLEIRGYIETCEEMARVEKARFLMGLKDMVDSEKRKEEKE